MACTGRPKPLSALFLFMFLIRLRLFESLHLEVFFVSIIVNMVKQKTYKIFGLFLAVSRSC